MARIACFTDEPTLACDASPIFERGGHSVAHFPARGLNDELRQAVQQFAPELVVVEVAANLDNLALFFFLRSDPATRTAPVVLLSTAPEMAEYAFAIGADAFVRMPTSPDAVLATVERLLPAPTALALGAR